MRKRILVGLAASAPLVIRFVGNTGCDKSSRSSLVIKKEQRGDLRAIVFGDTTHKQMLPDARLEVIDGPATGQLATFDAASGIYRFDNLAAGFVRVRASASAFEPVEQEIAVGTEVPREVVLTRTVPLPGSTHQLSGMVPQPGSSTGHAFLIGVKVEILDGPLAGVFTFTDEGAGIYVLQSLPPGVMRVRASSEPMSETVSIEISAPSTQLIFHIASQ